MAYSQTMRYLILPLILAVWSAVFADAELYKWVDKDGTVHFSDQPEPGAEKVKVQDIQTVPAVKTPKLEEEKKPSFKYDRVAITEPANEATLRDNTGNVSVSVEVVPQLRSDIGHRLVLSLDGRRQGEPGTAAQFSLANVERGTHTLQATVLDKDGKAVAGASSIFHLHRFAVQPQAPQGSP